MPSQILDYLYALYVGASAQFIWRTATAPFAAFVSATAVNRRAQTRAIPSGGNHGAWTSNPGA